MIDYKRYKAETLRRYLDLLVKAGELSHSVVTRTLDEIEAEVSAEWEAVNAALRVQQLPHLVEIQADVEASNAMAEACSRETGVPRCTIRIVCAWCQTVMQDGPNEALVSHGI